MSSTSGERFSLANTDDLARVFRDDEALLISAPRVGHGGLLQLDRSGLHAIDRYSCLGLAISPDGSRLARGFTSGRAARPDCDVVLYDDAGFREFRRTDGIGNAHDVGFDAAGNLYVVNTAGNAIVRLRDDGGTDEIWAGPPYFDGWHVNCITEVDGDLYATAFTSTERASGWRDDPTPNGMLFRLRDGHVVVRGLAKPHDPRRLDGRWLACASGTSELVAMDDAGAIVARRTFANFTRGLHWNASHLFVGDSNPRGVTEAGQTSAIHVIDRFSWEHVATFALPVAEVYAVVHLPDGADRTARFDLTPLFSRRATATTAVWPSMDFVRPEAQGAVFSYALPAALPHDSHVAFDLALQNTTATTLASVGPVPVQIVLQWHTPDGNGNVSTLFELREPIAPGATAVERVFVPTPQHAGRYILRLALTQYGEAWTGVRIVTNNVFIDVRDDLPKVAIGTVLAEVAAASPPADAPAAHATWSAAGVVLDDGRTRTFVDDLATLGMSVADDTLRRAARFGHDDDVLLAYDAAGIVRARARRAWDDAASATFARVARAAQPLAVSAALVAGLRTGFATNGNRRREQLFLDRYRAAERTPRHGLFPASRLLDADSVRGTITGKPIARAIAPGAAFAHTIVVHNDADVTLTPSGPHDVVIGYRCFANDGTPLGEDAPGVRSALPTSIAPGASAEAAVRIIAPERVGTHRLVVTLLQEGGIRFADSDPAFAWSTDITVAEGA